MRTVEILNLYIRHKYIIFYSKIRSLCKKITFLILGECVVEYI